MLKSFRKDNVFSIAYYLINDLSEPKDRFMTQMSDTHEVWYN